jgi:hypothetical protein
MGYWGYKVGLACLVVGVSMAPDARSSEQVFYSSDAFAVSTEDLRLYLGLQGEADQAAPWGSPERVTQALHELYTLKVLEQRADESALLSKEQIEWIAYYSVALEKAKRLIASEVEKAMSAVDWAAEARDYYAGNLPEFVRPPSITVRTLLLRTQSRSVSEAIDLARELVPPGTSEEEFREIVLASSEDPSGGDGKIEGMRKGQTVPEFEKAAFALEAVGDISEPVASRFGVHVIQLLAKNPESAEPFESVEGKIVATLKEKRSMEFANAVRSSPSEAPPADVTVHQGQIDAFMESVRYQYMSSKREALAP